MEEGKEGKGEQTPNQAGSKQNKKNKEKEAGWGAEKEGDRKEAPTRARRPKNRGGEGGGWRRQATPRPRTPRARKQRNQTKKNTKRQSKPRRRPSKVKGQNGKRKGEAHHNAPGRLARPTRPGRTSTRTHARDPGGASSDLQGEVSASTRNSFGAPAESRVEGWTVQKPERVSDRVHTRQPPQRKQPETDAGGIRQGQAHRGAPNGYDAELAQRPCLGAGQRQAQ